MVIDGQTFDSGISRIDHPSIVKAHSGYCTTKRNMSCCIANTILLFSETFEQIHIFSTNDEWWINSTRKTLRYVFFSREFFEGWILTRKITTWYTTWWWVWLIMIIVFYHGKLYKKARGEARSIWRNSSLKNSQETRHQEGRKPYRSL